MRALRPACPDAATADSGSWPPAAPATSPAGGGPCRGPDKSRSPPSDDSPPTPPAIAPPAADTIRLHRHALASCPSWLGLRPPCGALLRSALLSHTPQLAGEANRAATALPPWLVGRIGRGAYGQCPRLPVRAARATNPEKSCHRPTRTETPARVRAL